MLCAGFPYDSHTNPDNNLSEWNAFTRQTRALRCMGSAALELAFVAAGRLDGFWEQRINPWDVTGGLVLIREAGGGSDWTRVMDASADLHEAVREIIADVRKRGDEALRDLTAGRGPDHCIDAVGLEAGHDSARETVETLQAELGLHKERLESARAAITAVVDAARGHRAALLCYERAPADCHRSVLAKRVARRLRVKPLDL